MKIQGKIALLAITLSLTSVALADPKAEIAARIQPVGQVATAAAAAPAATPTAANDSGDKKAGQTGKKTYEQFCTVCHAAGVAGAPKFGNAADWATRLKNANGKDDAAKMDSLLASATKGLNAMPPKGNCADCTPAELKSAIQYMIDGGKTDVKADAKPAAK